MTIAAESSAEDLATLVTGAVFFPKDPEFTGACQGFNLAAIHRPEVVVLAESASDIAAAVGHANRTGLTVHVHSTGHSMGVPAENGLLINTSRMSSVSIEPASRTARVGAGALWSDVIEAAAPHGLAPLNGSAVTVGVVGYTLGGGIGPMGRTFGFAADHVRRVQLITAEGEVVEVDARNEPELFWALCGGKCDVGIVSEIEFGLMEVADFYGGAIFYPGEAAEVLLHAFREWVETLPERTTASIALLRLPDLDEIPPPLRGKLSVHLRFVHLGDDAEGESLIAPMREVSTPLLDIVGRTPYAAIGSVHQDPIEPMPVWDGGILLREFPAEAVEALLAVAGPAVDVPLVLAEIRHLGGALGRMPEAANAVGGRDAAFSLCVIAPYPPPLQQVVDAVANGVLASLKPWASGGTAINFQGMSTIPEDICRAWPEETVTRLRQVKQTWDPAGRFRFAHTLS